MRFFFLIFSFAISIILCIFTVKFYSKDNDSILADNIYGSGMRIATCFRLH